jgi:class 3 adenylate cyclase/predicted ATPase
MTFDEILAQALDLLHREGRVSYRALKRRFALDDEYLEDLKAEIIEAKQLAVDEGGTVLVWSGRGGRENPEQPGIPDTDARRQTRDPRPVSYTPKHLAERILAEREALAARGAPDGERKTITALFADLKGSTALIEDLDPEEARALIDPALTLMMEAVHRYEGYVAQSLGDGIFALFGAPLAHEDHAQRALYAALRMQEEMRQYSDRVRLEKGVPLQIRVGLNTGEVVVRSIRKDDLHTDYVPVGHSTNIAARMEQLATPGTIVVSAHTHKLTAGYFAFTALGEVQVKGLSEPLAIYEVRGVGPLRTRIQVAAHRGFSRFVGRQPEMAQLERALAQTTAGQGQIVGVMGEAGVGKSRLFHEFKVVHHSGCLVLETFSVSHGKASAYLPLLELLKHYFQFSVQDDERTRREKIGGKVLMLDRSLEDTLPYLFFLLGLVEPTSPLQQMDAQIRRRRTFEAIKRLLIRESLNQPLILIFEDLHWLDSETQAFLQLLSESLATTRILLLVNYRPEYQHEWGTKTYYTQLRLDPLGQAEAQEFLTALLGEGAELRALKQLMLEKTEGNPFFMEEIVQALVEQGVLVRDPAGGAGVKPASTITPLTAIHIPATVQGVLAARIDRLSPEEKALLHTLAVVGKQFSESLLGRVTAQPEEELVQLLAHLQAKEFIYEQPAFPESAYVFKHALTQEVAYNAVLMERRKVLHERTAQAMEGLYGERLADHYSELAHHFTRSGNTEKAIEYLQRAGHQAVQRSAYIEATRQLTTALTLLQTLPDTPARAQQELTVQIALGPVLRITTGENAPEVGHAYTRARELCQQLGDNAQMFSVLWGLRVFHTVRGEFQTARVLGEQLLSLAKQGQEPACSVLAHFAMGAVLFCQGELALAREHFDQGIALYTPERDRLLALRYGVDPKVICLSEVSVVLWLLGYPEQARKKSHEALMLAQALSHPFSLVFALYWAVVMHQHRREEPAAQERITAILALTSEHGFARWVALGSILQGWLLTAQGQREEGIAQMRAGVETERATGGALNQPYFLALLAEAYKQGGLAEEGLRTLAEALAYVNQTGERIDEAELYRLKGELLLNAECGMQNAESNTLHPTPYTLGEVEGCFLKAIEIARQQQAKSLELRATMSLARLWQQQGKKDEARQRLAEIYGWFTEGFGTTDLQEARVLLEELA